MKPETLQLLKNLVLGLGVLSVVALLLWGSWHLVRMPALTITDVVVEGGQTINHADVREQVEEKLAGEYWRFIPRRFAWTYPRSEILNTVGAVPRVKEPTVHRTGTMINVSFSEFVPAALWCDDDVDTALNCVFLDETGFAFAQTPPLSGGAFTRFVHDEKTATTSLIFGQEGDFAHLNNLGILLEEYGWPVATIEMDQARDAFVDLSGGSELKVTLRLGSEETFDNLQTILSTDEYDHLRPGNFHYIDLRFGNKVFVNEFGDSATTTVESAEQIE